MTPVFYYHFAVFKSDTELDLELEKRKFVGVPKRAILNVVRVSCRNLN